MAGDTAACLKCVHLELHQSVLKRSFSMAPATQLEQREKRDSGRGGLVGTDNIPLDSETIQLLRKVQFALTEPWCKGQKLCT